MFSMEITDTGIGCNKLKINTTVLYGSTDYSGRLGTYDTFKEFMELAGIHAKKLNMAQDEFMARGLFWLTVRTRICFNPDNKPGMGSPVVEETWPVKPLSHKANRYYRISNSAGLVAEGITEWAVMNFSEGRLANIPALFPPDMVYSDETLSFSDFPTVRVFRDELSGAKALRESSPDTPDDIGPLELDAGDIRILGTYNVSSSDIDAGQHMNNAAYVRAILGLFTVDELKKMRIREMTAVFKKSAHEGDVLTAPICRESEAEGAPTQPAAGASQSAENPAGGRVFTTGLYFTDGSPAFLARIITE